MEICKKIFKKIIELIYPSVCVFCGNIESTGACEKCKSEIQYIGEPRCKSCGKPIRYSEQEYCLDCHNTKFSFTQGISLWLHKGLVSKSIYQFKYHNRKAFAKYYAQEFARLYVEKINSWSIQVIIPVPLHQKRKRIRGYNQAEVLAKYLSEEISIPMEEAVERIKYTTPQKKLDNKMRKKNLNEAFIVSSGWPVKKRVLIVDDIYTTGSTINAIAMKLKEYGVEKVYFLTISIGQGF